MLKIVIFATIIFLVLCAMKIYVYMRFFRHSTILPKYVGGTLLILFAVAEVVLVIVRDSHFQHWQYLALGSCVVFGYTLFISCLCVDVVKFFIYIWRKYLNKSKMDTTNIALKDSHKGADSISNSSRREFFNRMCDFAIAILFVIFSFKSFVNALSVPPIREVRLKAMNLQRKFTIAMISDVHVGKTLGRDFLAKVVEQINALKVDIVVIVGDLVDDKIHLIKDDLEPLKDLQSTEGVFYVAGNHEYYHGVDSILEHIATLNMQILHNKNIELENVNLAGVSDLAGLQFKHLEPDLNKAREGLNPNKPSILLAHQPKFVRLNDVSDFDVVLCGHTHAGQVFPLSILVWLDQHYVHGLYTPYKDKKTQLYVSSGVGFWGPAIRFLAPSEIVHITLEA